MCRSRVSLLIAACALLVTVLALPAFAATQKAQYVMKFGSGEPPDPKTSLEFVTATAFKQAVERLTDGAVTVELHFGGVLGDSEAMIQQIQLGALQGCPSATAKLAPMYPAIQVFEIPYLFASREVAYAVLDGPFGAKIIEDMARKTGIRILMLSENGGFRAFTNNTRRIRVPADMKGLKFRVMQVPLHMELVKNLGAIPAVVSFSELYTAIQTNVVQGQENAPVVTRAFNLNEVQKYLTLDNHVYSASAFITSERWLQSLPEAYRKAIHEAAKIALDVNRTTSARWETEAIADLKRKGMDVYQPTPDEIEQFRAATQQPAISWLKQQIGAAWVDEVLEATRKAESSL